MAMPFPFHPRGSSKWPMLPQPIQRSSFSSFHLYQTTHLVRLGPTLFNMGGRSCPSLSLAKGTITSNVCLIWQTAHLSSCPQTHSIIKLFNGIHRFCPNPLFFPIYKRPISCQSLHPPLPSLLGTQAAIGISLEFSRETRLLPILNDLEETPFGRLWIQRLDFTGKCFLAHNQL